MEALAEGLLLCDFMEGHLSDPVSRLDSLPIRYCHC